MGSTGHLSVQPGKRVMIHMRDGTKAMGKFVERKSGKVTILQDIGWPITLSTNKIKTISIYKPREITNETK